MNYFEFSQWVKKTFNHWPNQKKKQPKNLKEMLDTGLISEEEFLRFTIVQKQSSLDKSKKKLLKFLKKSKK